MQNQKRMRSLPVDLRRVFFSFVESLNIYSMSANADVKGLFGVVGIFENRLHGENAVWKFENEITENVLEIVRPQTMEQSEL